MIPLKELGPEVSRPEADGIGRKQLQRLGTLHPELELGLLLEYPDQQGASRHDVCFCVQGRQQQ